ncbi:MAG: GTP cyclohydrolase II [Burkholderiaceae bacterium]|uniref:GTP cyclohydrolase-2 n=1 Tax=Herminiimonas contaminans TaxID=1111140 RepID=A0ABS0EXJ3_9BURK|nr:MULTISPECIES: GTP cyclohydrolase II [Oxalobacteraceae]MBF8179495.1 GTP cyclohydrolase II [Herminiimonas contaminans]MBX9800176.1 GTP cyclohydrolase II [Burkholderiaceae bacterium]
MNTSLTPNAAVEAAVSSEVELDYAASCELPTPWATFRLHAFVEPGTGKEHVAITLGDVTDGEPVLSRIHSECLTGDGLFSLRCDCGPQLEAALKRIAEEGRGALFYLRQEGRGIGLVNKIRAYQLQDAGADTVEANEALGFKPDQRNYKLCQPMLRHLKISTLRLMTNNPRKIKAMEQLGVKVVERVPLVITRNPFNERYLTTKAAKLGHLF